MNLLKDIRFFKFFLILFLSSYTFALSKEVSDEPIYNEVSGKEDFIQSSSGKVSPEISRQSCGKIFTCFAFLKDLRWKAKLKENKFRN